MMKESFKSATAAMFIVGAMFALSAPCCAQDTGSNRSQPHFTGQPPGQAQAILRKSKGLLKAVDLKAMTLTINSSGQDFSLKMTSKTKFSIDGKAASFKDAAAGKTVEAIIKMVYGQPDEAIAVNILTK